MKPTVKILSLCSDEYSGLAKLTVDGNKRVYCQKHGYELIDLRVRHTSSGTVGWERIEAILGLFSKHRNHSNEWIWVMGVDTMIMNFGRRLEEFVDPLFHFIIAEDHVYRLNADSFIVRNTPEGRSWLEFILSMRKVYCNHGFCEQGIMIDWYCRPPFAEWIKVVPQTGPCGINAYQNKLRQLDESDPGQWQKGDFLLHWAGASLEVRLREAAVAANSVLKSNGKHIGVEPGNLIWTPKPMFDFKEFYKQITDRLPLKVMAAEIAMMDKSSSEFLVKCFLDRGVDFKLWLIDTYCGEGYQSHPQVEFDFRKRLESVSRYPDGYFDFVFLGLGVSREKEPIKAEIRLWWSKLKEEGILAGHGYLSRLHGVNQAVSEVIPNPYTRPALIHEDSVQQRFEPEEILGVHETENGYGIWSIEKKHYINLL